MTYTIAIYDQEVNRLYVFVKDFIYTYINLKKCYTASNDYQTS